MEIKEKGNLIYLESEVFFETGLVTHAFCGRKGGISKSPFDSLNLSYRVGDKEDKVLKNYKIIGEKFEINHNHIVTVNQSHGDEILIIDTLPERIEELSFKAKNLKKDALITNKPLIPLGVLTADCLPIMFLDRKNQVIALAHAGWRGTVLRIGQKVFSEMKRLYGTSPHDCLVSFGASIKECCYEVGEEVIRCLKENFPNWMDFVTLKGKGKWNFAMVDLNLFQMTEIGIPPENISRTNLCTSCHQDLFFSYRAENGITGRCLSFIMLK